MHNFPSNIVAYFFNVYSPIVDVKGTTSGSDFVMPDQVPSVRDQVPIIKLQTQTMSKNSRQPYTNSRLRVHRCLWSRWRPTLVFRVQRSSHVFHLREASSEEKNGWNDESSTAETIKMVCKYACIYREQNWIVSFRISNTSSYNGATMKRSV